MPRMTAPAALVATAVVLAAAALAALGASMLLAQRSEPSALAALEGGSVDRASLPGGAPLREVAGLLVVEARVTGLDESVALVLDTGAPTSISADLAERAAGAPVGHIAQAGIDGEVETREVVVVPRLELGDATFRGVGAVRAVMSLDDPLACASRHGLVGASLMKDAVWQIDHAAGRLTIAPRIDGLDHVEDAIALPFTASSPSSPSPVVDIEVGQGRLSFLVDTGSSGWLAAHPGDLAGAGVPVDPGGPAHVTRAWGSGGSFIARVTYGATDVRLGGRVLGDLPIGALEALKPGLGSMGNAFLRHFVVTIDWPARRLYLDPLGSPPRPEPPPLARVGWGGTQMVIASFVEGPTAREAGLAIGLPVLALDGRDLTHATRDDACALIVRGQPASFDMRVRGGRSVHVAPVAEFFEPLTAEAAPG